MDGYVTFVDLGNEYGWLRNFCRIWGSGGITDRVYFKLKIFIIHIKSEIKDIVYSGIVAQQGGLHFLVILTNILE